MWLLAPGYYMCRRAATTTAACVCIRGVTIPGLESESELDFHHFLGINDSNSNSKSCKNQFSYCTGIDSGTGIDSKMDSIPIPNPILIPVKNGIVTPLSPIPNKKSALELRTHFIHMCA